MAALHRHDFVILRIGECPPRKGPASEGDTQLTSRSRIGFLHLNARLPPKAATS
jgi:hypothetical protein